MKGMAGYEKRVAQGVHENYTGSMSYFRGKTI
jgi:hypothetical protein